MASNPDSGKSVMNQAEIRTEVDRLLISHFSRNFWLTIADEMHAAYGQAHDINVRQLKLHPPELVRHLPQTRHYKLNSAIRDTVPALGYEVLDLKATNKGENYVVVRSGTLQLGRIGVNQGGTIPRTAKHRKLIAALNARLEGVTHDLFSPNVVSFPTNTLGMLMLNINPKKSLPQDRMLDLQIGVPFTDLSGWHYRKSFSELISNYNEFSGSVQSEEQRDGAIVRLKEGMRRVEDDRVDRDNS